MTTIAWDGKTLATDSQCTGEYTFATVKARRLEKGKYKGYIAAGCGTTALCNAYFDALERGKKLLAMKRKGERADILLVKGRKAFYFDGCYPYPFAVQAPFAMGSGGVFALAVMRRGFIAHDAVELAIECDSMSGGPIQVFDP